MPAGKPPKILDISKCKSYAQKIDHAIHHLRDSGGSSRQAIKKYLIANWDSDNPKALRKALKQGVEGGRLEQIGQRFKFPGVEYKPEPGTFVEMEDVKIGDGEEAEKGDTITVSYRGSLDDGTVFDQAKSFTFTLGAGDVIKGWDQGVAGMCVGGKRKLVVPPSLGYGKRGSGKKGEAGSIPPSATLHFTIALKKVS